MADQQYSGCPELARTSNPQRLLNHDNDVNQWVVPAAQLLHEVQPLHDEGVAL